MIDLVLFSTIWRFAFAEGNANPRIAEGRRRPFCQTGGRLYNRPSLSRTSCLMHSFSDAVVLIAVLAVAVVLVLGLVNMLRQGPGAPNRSQTFMRWRVGLQFLAIVAIVIVLYLRRH